jgi:hypothetical protein
VVALVALSVKPTLVVLVATEWVDTSAAVAAAVKAAVVETRTLVLQTAQEPLAVAVAVCQRA